MLPSGPGEWYYNWMDSLGRGAPQTQPQPVTGGELPPLTQPPPLYPQEPVVPQEPTPPAGPLALPDWSYDSSGLTTDKYGTLQASGLLQDYYGQLTNGYLPQLDQFAKDNAGQMVSFDPNRFMSLEDFGLDHGRGDLRNLDVLQASHSFGQFDENNPSNYYVKDGEGYKPIWNLGGGVGSGLEGQEIFTMQNGEPTWENNQGTPVYTSAGKYHKETPQEAAARLIAQGGGYKSGNNGRQTGGDSYDFMGVDSLNAMTTKGSEKWGTDYVNDPTLKQYLDDPSWVSKDENGNITAIRSELYPLLARQSLGGEYQNIARGGTKASDGIGGLVKGLILGTVTGGLGLAGASAMGMGSAAAGAGLGATAAGMGYGGLATAGAISGGLSSALTGGDVLKGALTGGLAGGFTKFASPYVGDTLSGMGVTGTTNKILSGGLTSMAGSGLGSAITGGEWNPAASFATGALGQVSQSQKGWLNNVLGEAAIDPQFASFIESQAGKALIQKITTGEIRMNPGDVVPFLASQAGRI